MFSLLPVGIGGGSGPGLGGGPGEGGPGKGDQKGPGGEPALAEKKIKGTGKMDMASLFTGKDKGPKTKSGPFGDGGQGLPGRVILEIELLGGKRYKGDSRFYLIHGKYPARDLAGVEELFQKVGDPLARQVGLLPASSVGLMAPTGCGPLLAASAAGPRQEVLVQIRLFPDSVDESHSAVLRLRELAERKYRLATIIVELP